MSRTANGRIWDGFLHNKEVSGTLRTCASRAFIDNVAMCIEHCDRCIVIPPNVCRMRPMDSTTGKRLQRKFTVKKEGVTAKWWEENQKEA